MPNKKKPETRVADDMIVAVNTPEKVYTEHGVIFFADENDTIHVRPVSLLQALGCTGSIITLPYMVKTIQLVQKWYSEERMQTHLTMQKIYDKVSCELESAPSVSAICRTIERLVEEADDNKTALFREIFGEERVRAADFMARIPIWVEEASVRAKIHLLGGGDNNESTHTQISDT